MTQTPTSSSQLWETEYARGGIPSSTRSRPSNVVVEFLDFVRPTLPQAPRALDIGCGSGRNALFLAREGFEVSAMDYAQSQVERLTAQAKADKLKIDARLSDVSQPWPWPGAQFDVAIDAFCFKHQIEPAAIGNYIAELRRCLKPDGRFMLFLATREDGYYRQFEVPEQYGTGSVIVDAGNNIASRLYSRGEIEGLFQGFDVLHFSEKRAVNEMHGKLYDRCSAAWYFRKA
jgi:SAM-dependent methyltransferase